MDAQGPQRPRADAEREPVTSTSDLLDRIDSAAQAHERTSIGDVLDQVGTRSFGPLLLLAGLVMMAPVVGDIPGVPVLMGFIVILCAGQFLLGRDHFWLPQWLLRRAVAHGKVQSAVRWLRPVARVLDRWSSPRLVSLTHGAGVVVAAVASTLIAAATPVMEIVPLSANLAGAAITAFGLALISADGVIALLAIGASAGTFYLLLRHVVA